MGHHPARAMYDQLEDGLISITRQLRSAIEADARMPGRVNGKPQAAAEALHRASAWAREVSAELGSVLLDPLGLAATIEWHVRQFQRCTGVLYELTVNDTAGFDLPDDYAATIFDVYNEALSNVARHSGARRVAIALTITPHEVTLVVRDDGIGLGRDAPALGVGGFAAMRARSQAYKGVCEVAGERNAGTTVAVSLPIPRDQRP
jgi:two-component system, NarL family, sensor histidine kinase UhpB